LEIQAYFLEFILYYTHFSLCDVCIDLKIAKRLACVCVFAVFVCSTLWVWESPQLFRKLRHLRASLLVVCRGGCARSCKTKYLHAPQTARKPAENPLWLSSDRFGSLQSRTWQGHANETLKPTKRYRIEHNRVEGVLGSLQKGGKHLNQGRPTFVLAGTPSHKQTSDAKTVLISVIKKLQQKSKYTKDKYLSSNVYNFN